MGGKMPAEYHKKYYHEKRDKKKIFEQKEARRTLLKQQVLDYLKDRSCAHCPESDPVALEFDHLDPSNKIIAISDTIRHGWSFKRILTEIAKCQVLCANCHRKKTAKELGYFRHID